MHPVVWPELVEAVDRGPLRNGTDAANAHAPALEQAIHLALVNRGCLIAPFHNMMLVCPSTTITCGR